MCVLSIRQQLLKEQQLNLHIDMLGDRYSRWYHASD